MKTALRANLARVDFRRVDFTVVAFPKDVSFNARVAVEPVCWSVRLKSRVISKSYSLWFVGSPVNFEESLAVEKVNFHPLLFDFVHFIAFIRHEKAGCHPH